MAPTATVGLVGSRAIDQGLQSSDKKTVTEFAFPQDSRTPNQIGIPHEGAFPNKNSEKLGDSYTNSVEDTNMLKVRDRVRRPFGSARLLGCSAARLRSGTGGRCDPRLVGRLLGVSAAAAARARSCCAGLLPHVPRHVRHLLPFVRPVSAELASACSRARKRSVTRPKLAVTPVLRCGLHWPRSWGNAPCPQSASPGVSTDMTNRKRSY
jgi:hypothetical protein